MQEKHQYNLCVSNSLPISAEKFLIHSWNYDFAEPTMDELRKIPIDQIQDLKKIYYVRNNSFIQILNAVYGSTDEIWLTKLEEKIDKASRILFQLKGNEKPVSRNFFK